MERSERSGGEVLLAEAEKGVTNGIGMGTFELTRENSRD